MIKTFKKSLKIVTIAVAVLGGSYGFLNTTLDNKEYINGDFHSVSKIDKTNFIEFTQYDSENFKENEVRQYCFFGPSKFITDGGVYGKNDGLVDKIYITGSMFGKTSGTLIRKENYEKFKNEFDQADKLLAETKEKFSEYFK